MSDENYSESQSERQIREQNKVKFFGRRHGRTLTGRKKALVEDFLPQVSMKFEKDQETQIDLDAQFGQVKDEYWLEVGFGSGEHLAWHADQNPNVGIIGCEPFINGVARLLVYLEDEQLENVRVHKDDARPLMDLLPDKSLSRIFVLFPDPWPKTRHRLRRFIGPDNLPRIARLLKDGGELRVASDHKPYVRWAMTYLSAADEFEWLDEGVQDWYNRRDDWPATRYEQKALAGRPHYLRFRRKARS